ncbi:MAG: UDP-N-acetylmuramate--L-alanine ligase [Oligoflexus sp.]
MTKQSKAILDPVHFIGIGGSGMTPLAEISLERGLTVSGSDLKLNANTTRLQQMGAAIYDEHKAEHLKNVRTVVVSSAISETNPELQAAKALADCTVLHRSEYLAKLTTGHLLIAVAGTHGKTTTAALITHVLQTCQCHPTAAIGGEMLNYHRYSLTGHGDYFVIEADESDGSFLNYEPFITLVNNIDLDHMDFFGTIEGTQQAFKAFMAKTHKDGWLIVNWDDPLTFNTSHDFEGDRLTFGKRLGSEIRLLDRSYENGFLQYQVMAEHENLHGQAQLMGAHNTQNILACIAVAKALELDIPQVLEAIASFKGVKRRLSLVYSDEQKNFLVYDDYAHNPVKISACINALREGYPQHELVVIFQPHRYSRLQTMYNGFIEAFRSSRHVYILPVFAAGETNQGKIIMDQLRDDISQKSQTSATLLESFPNPATLTSQRNASQKVVFLTVGAGDVNQFADALRDHLHEKTQDSATKKEIT